MNLHQASLKKLPPFLLFMFDKFVNCFVAFVRRDISVCDVVWTSVDKADCLEFCQSEKSIWPQGSSPKKLPGPKLSVGGGKES